jgi:penicillin-binding protein-related factor A (putative recombinase)
MTPAKSPANRGRSLETVIVASQGRYVTLDQHGQQARRIGGGQMVAVKGPVDFSGTVKGSGRSIRFDAKTCAQVTRFPIGNRDHFPEHQRQCLIRHGEAGAVAGLLVEATSLGMYLWLEWPALVGTLPASISWDDSRWVDLGPTTHAIRFNRIPGVIVLDERAGVEA